MNHAFACQKDAASEPACTRWCGRQHTCLSTLTYPEDYMQSAYEHGLRDGLAGAKTDGRGSAALQARLAECLQERAARQKHRHGYPNGVSDGWLERDIAALQRMLADGVPASERVQLPEKARAGIEVLHRVVESLLTTSRYVDEEGEATQALADLSDCIADPPFTLAGGVPAVVPAHELSGDLEFDAPAVRAAAGVAPSAGGQQ